MNDLEYNKEHFLSESIDRVVKKIELINKEYKGKHPIMINIRLTNGCSVELGIGCEKNLSMILFGSSNPEEDTLQTWDWLCSWGDKGIVFKCKDGMSFESTRYNLVDFEAALEELKWIASYGEISDKFRWCSL